MLKNNFTTISIIHSLHNILLDALTVFLDDIWTKTRCMSLLGHVLLKLKVQFWLEAIH